MPSSTHTRPISFIVIHTTLVPHATVESIRRYHVENKGWADIGYHCVIQRDASIHSGRSEALQGAHTRNQPRAGTEIGERTRHLIGAGSSANVNSLGIVVCGGFHLHTNIPTQDQVNALIGQIAVWCQTYDIDPHDVYGHRDFQTTKPCPGRNLYPLIPTIRRSVATRLGMLLDPWRADLMTP